MRSKFAYAFLLVVSILSIDSDAFGQTTRQTALWYGYHFTIPISGKWYNVTEIQERHLVGPIQQNQFLIRTRFHKALGRNWDGSTGMSLFLHHRENPSSEEDFNWPEIRPHLEITLKSRLNSLALEQRVRGEARYFQNIEPESETLNPGFYFGGFRARYRFQATFPIGNFRGKTPVKLKIADEIMAMAGGKIGDISFDQNRISSDLIFELNPKFQLEFGYVYWHQARNPGGFLDQHIFRTYLRHTLDLKKKSRKSGL